MQLDALFLRRVRALGVVDLHDVLRVELHVLTIVGELHAAADAQPHADADLAKKLCRLALGHAAADEERAFVVRHFEQHRPDAGAARLVAVELEDLALDHADGEHSPLCNLAAHDDTAAAAHLAASVLQHVGKGLRR